MFKSIFIAFVAILLFAVPQHVSAKSKKEITFDKIPQTVEEFLELRGKLAKTPEGGATMMLVALLGYANDKKLGRKFLTIALHRDELQKGNDYKGYSPRNAMNYHFGRFKNHWPYAYLKNAKIENGYKVQPPYTVVASRDKRSGKDASGKVKIYLDVAGFRPRGVTMQVNSKGIWKATYVSSFFLDVPLPKKADDL